MRIARVIVSSSIIVALAAGGAMIAPPALQSWQLQQAKDDPSELSRLRLVGVATQDRIAPEIDRAVAAGDLGLAESFVALAAERGIATAPERVAQIEALRQNALTRAVSDFGHGFVAGERESDAAFAGALVGDISGFGDLRDLVREGHKLVGGETIDETVLALAAVGLAVSAATWVSLGGSLPARGGVSAIKAASKAKLLSPVLTANLGRMAAGAVDRPALTASLGAAARLDLAAAKTAAGGIVRPAALARFTALGQDAGALYARTGQRGLRQVLAVAEDAGDVGRAAKLAAAKPSTVRATLRLLGRSALVLGALSLQAAGWMLALLGYALAVAMAAQRFGWWLGRLGRKRRAISRMEASAPTP
ncbi:hypothetical protein [Bosea sp. (in: a-proteobacteria)]|uniref:Uncharacterized protein n=1 Tax=Bosea vestrisii TaxID=151416 RepID=A0ABW0HBH0_9HYPH|nr:hypothetical protein [Bosea sp. (in: a-proteobacteria)]MBR3189481.1 hypothetical protein [Bosea sp. (in: a-proteobacteria)]